MKERINDLNEYAFTNLTGHSIMEWCAFNNVDALGFIDELKGYVSAELQTGYYCEDERYYYNDDEEYDD